MKKFSSIQELENWLFSIGVNTALWGINGAKSVDNLWAELISGDAYLQSTPPMRIVSVVQVFIRRKNRLLIETIQELSDGQRRYRNQPPAEKIKHGEHYLEAASRGLFEELGIKQGQVYYNSQSHFQRTLLSESPSYPGLLSQYTFHDIEANVQGLPSGDFWHDNYSFAYGDPVKRHFWSWRLPEELNPTTTNLNTSII
ncbi:MAG: NUDIX hydrolase [Chloroflexota bacterium]